MLLKIRRPLRPVGVLESPPSISLLVHITFTYVLKANLPLEVARRAKHGIETHPG